MTICVSTSRAFNNRRAITSDTNHDPSLQIAISFFFWFQYLFLHVVTGSRILLLSVLWVTSERVYISVAVNIVATMTSRYDALRENVSNLVR